MVGKYLIDGLYQTARDPRRSQCTQPVVDVLGQKNSLQGRDQHVWVLDAGRVGYKAGVVSERRTPQYPAKLSPLPVVPHRETKIPITGLEPLVGHDRRMGIAETARRPPGHQVVTGHVRQAGDLGVEQRGLKMAFAANNPAVISTMATPTFMGSPSGTPVMLMIPPRP